MTTAATGRLAPALFRRALFVLAGPLAFGAAAAPPNVSPPGGYVLLGSPDHSEGRSVIARFRESGPARPYYLEFILREMPRRGADWSIPGRLWGSRNEAGSVLRIELDGKRPGEARRFIVQNGARAAVWAYDPSHPERSAGRAAPAESLAPQLEITPFDLQMPYFYWPDARLMGVTRIRGRPAHQFLFTPPAGFPVKELAAVRAYLDTQFNAPVQTELLGADGQPRTILSLVDLKKVGDEWIPKDIEIRNERTRDKTRFSVTGAALGLDLLPELFQPGSLTEAVSPPAADRIVRFEP